jgi:hypothetical protein
MKPGDLPSSKNEPLNGPPVARTALKAIAKMDRTYLVLVSPGNPLSPIATKVICLAILRVLLGRSHSR